MKYLLTLLLVFFGFSQVLAQNLEIDFLDVGQGDAVFMRTPEGKTILYDSGPKASTVVKQLTELGVTDLDLVVLSHADRDHIGAMADVVNTFKPKQFLWNDVPSTIASSVQAMESLERVGSQELKPTEQVIELGEKLKLQVLPPQHLVADQNENSLGIIVKFGGFRMILTGDSTPANQKDWISKYRNAVSNVDIYKSSHHGTRAHESQAWLELLRPQDVVISLGERNASSLSDELLLTLDRLKARVWRTDEVGRIKISVKANGDYVFEVPGQNVTRHAQFTDLDISAFAEHAKVIRRVTLRSKQSFISFEPDHLNALVTIQDAMGQVMLGNLSAGMYYLTFSNPGFHPRRQQVRVEEGQQVVIEAQELEPDSSSNSHVLTWSGTNLTYMMAVVSKGWFVPDITTLEPGQYTIVFAGQHRIYLSFIAIQVVEGSFLTLSAPSGEIRARIEPSSALVLGPAGLNLDFLLTPRWRDVEFSQPLTPDSPGHVFQGSVTPSAAVGVGDLDCRDFPSQAAAQAFFDALGGVGHDVHDLDRDHDGIPCERNEAWTIKRNEPRPTVAQPTTTPVATPASTPSANPPASSPNAGMCWVNGYYKKNGTYVAGYWRRC